MGAEMTLQDHLRELRSRVIFSVIFFLVAFAACYFYAQEIYKILLKPFIEISNQQNRKLIYTSPAEAFVTYIKLSFSSALFFSTPIFLSEIYLFLSPALYKNEKKNVLMIFFFSPFLFLCGAIFAYFFILPLALKFFASFESQGFMGIENLSIQLETKLSEYLKFVTNLLLGFGVAFQLPILLLFLIRVDCLSINGLRQKRRYWIVFIFVISAILTPPDVVSQLSLAVLLITFFEIVILIGNNFNKKKSNHGYS
jgi:sec-independent protein translocase protein TatC